MLEIEIPTAEDMRSFGESLGELLRGGDMVMLNGPLGAGKTTMTQGIAEGMGVSGRVASPTFVIAQVHPSGGSGPDLVHVDAYRLTSLEELDALDLDTSLDESATVVEWGEGKVEVLAEDRLVIDVIRPEGGVERSIEEIPADAARTLRITGVGARGEELEGSLEEKLKARDA